MRVATAKAMASEVNPPEQHGPWLIKSRREVYQRDVFSVREDEVIQPDGKPGSYTTIKVTGGSAVLPFDGEHVYLAQEYRYGVGRMTLETCAGAIDEGETELEAAKRELREELAIEAARWTPLGAVELMTSRLEAPTTLFLAEELTFVEKEDDANERIEVIKRPLEEVVQMALVGELQHGTSCVLILRAHHLITQRRRKQS